jgi:hypothetical protein
MLAAWETGLALVFDQLKALGKAFDYSGASSRPASELDVVPVLFHVRLLMRGYEQDALTPIKDWLDGCQCLKERDEIGFTLGQTRIHRCNERHSSLAWP